MKLALQDGPPKRWTGPPNVQTPLAALPPPNAPPTTNICRGRWAPPTLNALPTTNECQGRGRWALLPPNTSVSGWTWSKFYRAWYKIRPALSYVYVSPYKRRKIFLPSSSPRYTARKKQSQWGFPQRWNDNSFIFQPSKNPFDLHHLNIILRPPYQWIFGALKFRKVSGSSASTYSAFFFET